MTQTHRNLFPILLGLALFVVGLGAYTRLTDSGLGCPDWPACYGQWIVEKSIHTPHLSPSDTLKAWTEMIHRYVAGFLGACIVFTLAKKVWHDKQQARPVAKIIPIVVALLVIQALFGMWTVTWKLHPLAVMPHLLGGMSLTLCLTWIYYRPSANDITAVPASILTWLWVCFVLLSLQVILGGWTSANYAALVCPDFPTCQGQWWPTMHFGEGFSIPPIGPNYEGGLFSGAARTAIHFSHRIGGLLCAIAVGRLCQLTWRNQINLPQKTQQAVYATAALVAGQILLGIANVLLTLPISIAVAHNLGALCILLSLCRILALHTPAYSPQKNPTWCPET